ncbi:MAG: hypothetical protein U1B78_07425, partial [Dehalococcoidia bacterium]|nr:hypothetical protein [Dehalococcoidia bacterium]
ERSFEVTASDGTGGGPPVTASGQFEELPFFSGWVGWASMGGGASLAGVAVIGVVLALMLGGGGGDDDEQVSSDPTATSARRPSPTQRPPPTQGAPDVDIDQLVTRDLPPEGDSFVVDTAIGSVIVERVSGDCVDNEGTAVPSATARVRNLDSPLILCLDTTLIKSIVDPAGDLTLHTWLCNENVDRIAFYVTSGAESELPDQSGTCESFSDVSAQRR